MKKNIKFLSLILKEAVRGLGSTGEVVKVRRGFAINWLIPQGKALVANDMNMKSLDDKKQEWLKVDEDMRAEGKQITDKIDGIVIDMKHNTIDGFRLHGSITDKVIAKKLDEMNISLPKNVEVLLKPIKEIGTFTAVIYTYGNSANLTINVMPIDND